MKTAQELWNETWSADTHTSEYAQKRIKSAKSSKLTPVKIDTADMYGYFQGSHGRYETFLDTCPCGDFIRAKKPCKHIYRLAMELGVMDSNGMSANEKMIPIPKKEKKQALAALVSILEQGGLAVMEAYYSNHADAPFFVNPQGNAATYLMEHQFWTEVKDQHIFTKLRKDMLISFLELQNFDFPKDAKVNELKAYILDNFYSEFKDAYPDRMMCIRSEEYTSFHYQLHSYCKKVVDPYGYLANCEMSDSNGYVIPDSELNRLYYEHGHDFDLDVKNNPYLVDF